MWTKSARSQLYGRTIVNSDKCWYYRDWELKQNFLCQEASFYFLFLFFVHDFDRKKNNTFIIKFCLLCKAGFPLGGFERSGYCSFRRKSNSLRLWRAFLKRQPIEMRKTISARSKPPSGKPA